MTPAIRAGVNVTGHNQCYDGRMDVELAKQNPNPPCTMN
jgi:hypothetical protein